MTFQTKDSGEPLDLKAVGDDGEISGYGSIFGNVDSAGEVVEPGAFTETLAESAKAGRPIKMLWQHDRDQPIGIWTDVSEDRKGLKVKGRLLIDVSAKAREVHGLLKERALDGLSIGYRTLDEGRHPTKPGIISLKKLLLREVSVVTFAANDKARVESVKHILAAGNLPSVREFEEFLRDAGGFSKSLAAAIAAKATPHLRGEPEAKAEEELRRFIEAMRA